MEKQIIVDNISTCYYIDETGKCFNSKMGRYLKGQVGKNGYFTYNLSLGEGKKKRCYAHILVAKAFLDKPSELHSEVNHIDGNKLNNNLENLEWVTPSENQQHAVKTELRKFNHVYCFNENKELLFEFNNIPEASKSTGVSYSLISQEVNKEIKDFTGGYYWSKEPILKEINKKRENCGVSKVVNQYDLDGKLIATYGSTGLAAKALGVKSSSHIGECCRGKIKTYKGFIWKYAEDIVSTFSES